MQEPRPDKALRAWIEPRQTGAHWYVRGDIDGERMELEGWEPDAASAMVVCTQSQVRWLMKRGMKVNRYVVPEMPRDEGESE